MRSFSGSSSPRVASCLSRCRACVVDSQMTRYEKLTQSKFGQAPKEMTECQTWIQDKLGFLRSHIRHKGISKSSAFKSQTQGASASTTTAHTAPEPLLTQTVRRLACGKLTPHNSFNKSRAPKQLQGTLRSTSRSWTSSHR